MHPGSDERDCLAVGMQEVVMLHVVLAAAAAVAATPVYSISIDLTLPVTVMGWLAGSLCLKPATLGLLDNSLSTPYTLSLHA